MQLRHLKHPFPPVIAGDSKILILGSVPSVKSVENGFYYMHPQNRFWKVLGAVLNEELYLSDIQKKKAVLLRHRIALYDSVEECDIYGSSDSGISNIVPADVPALLAASGVKRIFCNGSASFAYLLKYHPQYAAITCKLPSTSPANAAFPLEKLTGIWKDALFPYLQADSRSLR